VEYRSWISTLSGHLFFHLSQPWNYRLDRIVGDVVHLNEKIGDERYICISLLADVRDYNTKDKIKYSRIFFFGQTYLSENKDSKNLKGTISFFSNGKNELCVESEANILKDLELFRINLTKMKKDAIERNKSTLVEQVKSLETRVLSFSEEEKSVYTRKIQFNLESEGIIELGNAIDSKFTHPATKTVYRQAYYFIKFMFHNHTHHKKSAEDIIRLTKIPQDNMINYNKKFAYLMISDIKKYMVELRHSRKGFKDLEGLSAYAKSLLQVLEKKKFITSEVVKREEKYFDNFVQSVNKYISITKFNTVNTTFISLIDAFLKIFVILMSFIAPYTFLKSKEILGKSTITLNEWLVNDIIPIYIYGFFILLIIIPLSDLIYNWKHSFIHKIWNISTEYLMKYMKKNHNPTLMDRKINAIIDFRQSLHHIKFQKKSWYFYGKLLFSLIVLIVYIRSRFL